MKKRKLKLFGQNLKRVATRHYVHKFWNNFMAAGNIENGTFEIYGIDKNDRA